MESCKSVARIGRSSALGAYVGLLLVKIFDSLRTALSSVLLFDLDVDCGATAGRVLSLHPVASLVFVLVISSTASAPSSASATTPYSLIEERVSAFNLVFVTSLAVIIVATSSAAASIA